MNKLYLNSRPWVMFDPTNRQHRAWYGEYLRVRSWGSCPVRFTVDNEPGRVGVIERLLLEYYCGKEFKKDLVS
jgi:hypothetical protein